MLVDEHRRTSAPGTPATPTTAHSGRHDGHPHAARASTSRPRLNGLKCPLDVDTQ